MIWYFAIRYKYFVINICSNYKRFGDFKIPKSLLQLCKKDNRVVFNFIYDYGAVCKYIGGFQFMKKKKLYHDKLIIIDAMSPTVANLSQLLSVAIANEQGSFARAEIMNQCHYAVPVQLHCIYNADGTFQFYLRLLHNKYIDPITELPNGWAITSRVTYLLKHTHLTLKNLTLIIIGVDNFLRRQFEQFSESNSHIDYTEFFVDYSENREKVNG